MYQKVQCSLEGAGETKKFGYLALSHEKSSLYASGNLDSTFLMYAHLLNVALPSLRLSTKICHILDLSQEIENLRSPWVAQVVKRLPSAQVMIPESWDQARHQASYSVGSLLLPLP